MIGICVNPSNELCSKVPFHDDEVYLFTAASNELLFFVYIASVVLLFMFDMNLFFENFGGLSMKQHNSVICINMSTVVCLASLCVPTLTMTFINFDHSSGIGNKMYIDVINWFQ